MYIPAPYEFYVKVFKIKIFFNFKLSIFLKQKPGILL